MISGLGTDIVEIERIRKMVREYGDAFLERIFTSEELAAAADKRDPSLYYAGRWAAKEAVAKALGCGIGEKCAWKDINISNHEFGRPQMMLSGWALETASKMGVDTVHVSISHENHYACATVILESLK